MGLDDHDLQPAVRGMDAGSGIGRLTDALLDWLTHHVSILTMNGDSYRLKQSARRRHASGADQNHATEGFDPDTGEITHTCSTTAPKICKEP